MSNDAVSADRRLNILSAITETYVSLVRYFPSILIVTVQAAVFAVVYWCLVLSLAGLNPIDLVSHSADENLQSGLKVVQVLVERLGFAGYLAVIVLGLVCAAGIVGAPLSRKIILGKPVGPISGFSLHALRYAGTVVLVGLAAGLCFMVLSFTVGLPLIAVVTRLSGNLPMMLAAMLVVSLVLQFLVFLVIA